MEKSDASEIYSRRLNAKEVLISQKDAEFVFPVVDGSAKLSGRDCEFQEPNLRRESTVWRENLSRESHGDWEEFQPEETKDDAGIHKDFWSIQGDFIYRHKVEPRAQLYVPKEESFLIPLKYIDVMRSTHTNRDVAQEKLFDDDWNVDGNRSLSDSWTGFTIFTLLNETLPKRIRVVLRETDKNSNDITSKSRAKTREARMGTRGTKTRICQKMWGGSYSVDPSSEDYKEIIKNARRMLETPTGVKESFSEASIRKTVVPKTRKFKESGANTKFSC